MASWGADIEVQPTRYHNDVQRVIYQQNALGWRKLFNGQFGSAWSRTQDAHYKRVCNMSGTNDKRTGATWQKQFIVHIWQQWEKVWKICNEDVHGRDAATCTQAERREVERELRAIYDSQHPFKPRVQELLYREVHEHMHRPLWVTRNWLATNTPLFRESMRRAKTTATKGMRSIRPYFVTVR